MSSPVNVGRRQALRLLPGTLGAALLPSAWAHGSAVGDLRIEHPYALPSPPGARHGAAYLKAIVNRGDQPDQLIEAATPAAKSVVFHRSEIDAQQIARMRQQPLIEVPAHATLALRHDGHWHLMLQDLVAPLKVGDRFPLTLRFQRAGSLTVTAWVQQPRDAAQAEHQH